MEGTKKIHFSYDEDTMSNHKAFIWFWGIIFVTSYIACAMIWGINAPAIPFCFLFVYLFYFWCRRWESKNEKTERTIALNLMENQIKEDVRNLFGENISICSIGYFFLRNKRDKRYQCILVYLSNEKTLQYSVMHLPSEKDDVCCCEINAEPAVTEDRKLVRTVSPHFRPLLQLSPRNELKVRIFFIYTLGFVVIAIGLISIKYYKWIPLACFLGYLVVVGLLTYLCKKIKRVSLSCFFEKRFFHVLEILNYTVPTFNLAIVLFLSLTIALGIPAAILMFFESYTDFVLTKATQYFALLVLTTIILVFFNGYIQKCILNLLLKNDYEERLKERPFLEVALNIIKGRNINFLVYMMYVLFLSWTTIARLQGFDPWFSQDFIGGAMPAFLVHIAYTNMMLRQKEVDLRMDTMMKFMIKSYDIKVLQLNIDDIANEK